MKTFHCDNCRNLVFFENIECTKCGSKLAYLPDRSAMAAIQPSKDGVWEPLESAQGQIKYRLCANYETQNICNWAIADSDRNSLCRSCRLTRTIPDLTQAGHGQAWYKMEVAKRRLVYGLIALGLPIESRLENPGKGLAFDFLCDAGNGAAPTILTGHSQGLITINLAEADDVERERRRVAMHEPYRTLLGHFRHESGHYYWDRLIKDTTHLDQCRALFGDERQDYAAALKKHYDDGPTPKWNERYISEYASSHPWEDWAETWAHYLHIRDAMETAAECGLVLKPENSAHAAFKPMTMDEMHPAKAFDKVIGRWFALAQVINNFNRGLGLHDPYPFVLTPTVVDKLRFVHTLVSAQPVRHKRPAAKILDKFLTRRRQSFPPLSEASADR